MVGIQSAFNIVATLHSTFSSLLNKKRQAYRFLSTYHPMWLGIKVTMKREGTKKLNKSLVHRVLVSHKFSGAVKIYLYLLTSKRHFDFAWK
jgi:hypothetical protein